MFTIREINTLKEFADLKPGWKRLVEDQGSEHIFQTFEWNYTWWKHFESNRNLRILIAVEKNRVVGILPLMYSRRGIAPFCFGKFEYLAPKVSNYHDFVIGASHNECIEALVWYLFKRMKVFDYAELRYIPEDSPNLPLVLSCLRAKGIPHIVFEHEPTQSLKIHGPWENYLKGISKSLRHDIRRKIRRAEERGPLNLHECRDETDVDEVLRKLHDLQVFYWRERGLSSDLEDDRHQKFNQEIGKIFLENGWLFSHWLEFEKEIAACHFGFLYNDHVYYHQISYLPKYSKFSPGKLLQYFEIQKAFSLGISTFDFAQGDVFYKKQWCSKERRTYRVYIFKHNYQITDLYLKVFKPMIKDIYMSNDTSYFKKWLKKLIDKCKKL